MVRCSFWILTDLWKSAKSILVLVFAYLVFKKFSAKYKIVLVVLLIISVDVYVT